MWRFSEAVLPERKSGAKQLILNSAHYLIELAT